MWQRKSILVLFSFYLFFSSNKKNKLIMKEYTLCKITNMSPFLAILSANLSITLLQLTMNIYKISYKSLLSWTILIIYLGIFCIFESLSKITWERPMWPAVFAASQTVNFSVKTIEKSFIRFSVMSWPTIFTNIIDCRWFSNIKSWYICVLFKDQLVEEFSAWCFAYMSGFVSAHLQY